MANVITTVKRRCASFAAVSTGCYSIAHVMAVSDGAGVGVEIPRPLDVLSIMLIICSTVLGGVAWLVEQGIRIGAEEHIRPVVRDELARALDEQLPVAVASVVERLDQRLVPQMHGVAELAGRQSAVRLREMVTQDLREILGDYHRRALITGQIMQANATGSAIGRAALRSIPRSNLDDN